ncbi:hypothetical protein EBS80_01235 [bacterium]|nr:hypothetical protein [bacterium]
MRHRERRQDRLEAEWAPRFERWQQEFSEAVDRAIASGLLPPNPNYRQRVADVRFILLDPIVGGNRGGRVYDSGIISINVDRMDEEATKLTVFHELSHQISGTMIQQVVTEQGTPGSAHARRKTGLEFQSRHDGRKQGTWLNEALTELLARRLAGTEETSSYLHEQAVVLSLVEGGAVPMSLFYRAYCESPDTPANRRSGLPAYRELNRAMTKALGPGWLRRVDDFVKQQYEAERM